MSSGAENQEGDNLKWYDVDTPEFVELVAKHQEGRGGDLQMIDVREPEELEESGKIPGTINIPRNGLLLECS